MIKNRKYSSHTIAIAGSLALYGVCFLLLSLNPSPYSAAFDLFEQEEDKFSIDIQSDFQISDEVSSERTAKGSVDANKAVPPPSAALTQLPAPKDANAENKPPAEEQVTVEEDLLMDSKLKEMVTEMEHPSVKDSIAQIEKKLLQAATQKKVPNQAEINRLSKEEQQFYRKHYKTIVNMRKIYPSVLAVTKIVEDLNAQIESSKNKKEKQQLIKLAEQKLFTEFEKDIRVMSYSQGKLLVKLLARETDQSAYNIIKKYKGTIPASFWYGVGILFQENLKTKYDSVGEDAHLERMVRKYKAGVL